MTHRAVPAFTAPWSPIIVGRPRSCQWPLWAHGEATGTTPRFCDAALDDQGSYCPDHRRLSRGNYVPSAIKLRYG
jgi:hypothetical protein